MALIGGSITVHAPVLTNLIIYRTCYVNLGYNESECALLGSENKDNYTQKLEGIVEPYANIISMVSQLPVGILCAILALFIGSWSDRYGRKPVMIATIIGQTISFGVIIVFCLLPNISAWYLVLSSVPIILSGGFAAALTTYLSYLTDITDETSRGVRMGIFEVVLSVGMLLGMISSSYIFNATGYIGIFVVAAGLYIIALIYTIFVLEESLPNRETEGKFRTFFEFENIKVMTITTFKKRPDQKRTLILLCLTITSLFIFAVMSEGSCVYMFLRLKFGWTLRQYTFFTSVRDVLSILGTFIGIYGLHKVLKVDETIVILMGLISCMNGTLVLGLASTNAHIYFGGVLRLLTGNVAPMLRSLLSKITEPHEVGKIFSVLVMCENFLQMLGSPLYTYIYNETLDTHPEFFNFVTVGVLGLIIILTLIVTVMYLGTPNEPKFTVLSEAPPDEDDIENEIIAQA
ncbi:hypothetical protein HHI36_002933 [Cryptolaemus montrouzieri]|uniref:Major facilitator superfamily (MFS) profile domain-containing protein n=1 Tax=Cryptolaemus montrouzieri TaxID=559131 RepID=A0ABD2PCH3_9CUCU